MSTSANITQVEALWFPLVKKFYQTYYPSGKPNKSEPLWVIKQGPTIIAAVRIKPFVDCQLMTGLVTHPEYRQQGYGSTLLDALRSEFEHIPSFCLNQPELIPFYQQHDFVLVQDEHSLPDDIQGRLRRYRVKQPELVAMVYQSATR
ncbi:GNAT family N-acetyltransferase [Marinomonas fungiae]|uniref:Acetyltransferase (GNAT) domain n=1 Tax=Marinomonas fungiae TaxID=1137284 RepID=A0A0K6IL78_9GAMM|nr:GNAT family N-acetyltransferase [Marinomonas fungiae]CUB03844.1 Acetyltransferase (GNAT) domain [Marinomonas fungiae]